MRKTLRLEVDRASWSNVLPKYRKACPFTANQTLVRIDFLRAMLWIGVMSVPIQIPRWWLASQWAVLRYVAAVDHTNQELRLHPAIDDLESHHKTVLSDDWGVGLSLQWLDARLRYKHIVHGVFAMRALQSAGIATYVKRKKRGPFKCPDFFAVDRKYKIHLIECKGNQAGLKHIDKQFEHGRKQKENIRFVNEGLVGQRLLCGAAIAGQESNWESTLRIADPPPRDERGGYEILAKKRQPIVDAFKKVLLVQGLIAAGQGMLAHRLYPIETAVEEEQEIPEMPTAKFEAEGEGWRGLVYEMHFPLRIGLEEQERATSCRMRFGVNEELLSQLVETGGKGKSDFIAGLDFDLRSEREPDDVYEVEETGKRPWKEKYAHPRRASIQQGRSFIADLELL